MKNIFLSICILSIIFLAAIPSFGQNSDKVNAYYFHGSFRCSSCRFIEQNTESALKQYFAEELKSGKLVFKHVNIEEKENKHFINHYQLYTKSVILSLVKDGKEVKWKNLDKVWHILNDKNKFHNYIKSETQGFLDSLREGD